MTRGPIKRTMGDGPLYDANSGNVLTTLDQPIVKSNAERARAYRREASRLASMANKRVARLERNNLKDTPAYKAYIETGGKFSVKGKTYNQLQQEVARLRRFIDAKTSTIKGTNTFLKEMAANTGMKYENLTELRSQAGKFFELASKVEQYMRNVHDMASAIGYQKIWEVINQYVQEQNVDLTDGKLDIDSMIESVSKGLIEYENKMPIVKGWYTLKKSDLSKGE